MLFALAVSGAGCQSQPAATGRAEEEFLRDDETSAVTRLATRQTAAGAASDATLRPYHFDHDRLNSLGREKLDLMAAEGPDLRSADGGEFVVYLDVAGDADGGRFTRGREADVAQHMTERGLDPNVLRIEAGPNPHNTMTVTSASPPKEETGDGGLGALFAEIFKGPAGK